jgi:energy-coupling factor transporter ATP-binding protein EcfA2
MPRIPQTDQAAALLYHARSASPFLSKDGQPCASVPGALDSRHIHPIRSAAFRDWLTSAFYNEFEIAPSPLAYRSAIRVLEARAKHGDFPSQKLDRRLGFEGDSYAPSRIILDLANPSGQVLEMDSHGWRIRDNMNHSFRQSISTLALPRPLAPLGDQPTPDQSPLDQFARLFLLDNSARARVAAWLVNALRPGGPYPILVLQGPSASGKSTLARALRALIDPSPALVRRFPDRDEELPAYAFENWILAFDDAYHFSAKIADALRAVSSGDVIRIPQPDLRDALEIEVARPIILAAPHDDGQIAWTPPRALSHRTVTLQRPQIRRPQPERAIWSEFESLRPALLAALAQAVVTALHRIRDIDLANVPRFLDSAYWCAAAAPALGFTEEKMVEAISDPTAMWIGSDPLRDALRTFLPCAAIWTGDATTLLNQLRAVAPRAALPATPKGLAQMLPGIFGFRVERTRTEHARTLTITRLPDLEQEATAGHINQN